MGPSPCYQTADTTVFTRDLAASKTLFQIIPIFKCTAGIALEAFLKVGCLQFLGSQNTFEVQRGIGIARDDMTESWLQL